MKLAKFKKELAGVKTVGVDTMVFIYLLEGNKTYLPLVKWLFELIEKGRIKIVSSYISYLETFSSPLLDLKRLDLYRRFFLTSKNLVLKEIDQPTADWAASLRRSYQLRTPDAIQIASAIISKADLFISNDKSCKKVKEIKTIILKDYL